MTYLDWALVAFPLAVVLGIAAYTQRFNKSVADFIAAGRCAGRYLLTTARGTAGSAVYTIAIFQIAGKVGFTFAWWSLLPGPILLLLASTGFVYYRYRETRALTVAQFLEMRYSRRFRLFMGGLAFLAGILNYGIFPAVSARFFVYFLGWPETTDILSFHVPTWTLVALAYLSCTLFLVLTGGQISLLITDCVEGIFSQVGYVVIAIAMICLFSWHQATTVLAAAPPGASLLNPFDTQNARDYNVWYVLIGLLSTVYGTMAWQNNHGFNSAALTPHESRMSNVLSRWRDFAGVVMRMLLVIGVLTFLNDPAFASQAARATSALHSIQDPQIQDQMRVPIPLSYLLPIGIKGLFCSIMLLGVISGDAIALHSWGSIFIQDVWIPATGRALSPRIHLRLLRLAIVGVAAFGFFFSLLFPQTQDIALWWIITGSIFLSGAGSVIIGGLYWRKGTTSAAWSAMIVGSGLSFFGILIQQIDPDFPIHSQYIGLIVMLLSIGTYWTISLLTCREDFDMDRMLHRGIYAIKEDHPSPILPFWQRFHPVNMLGIDREYSSMDKLITLGIFSWTVFWTLFFLAGCIWNFFHPWPLAWWERYWLISGIILPVIIAILTTIWFTIGGIYDIRLFFQRLRMEKRDAHDDGMVSPASKPGPVDQKADRGRSTGG